MELIIKTTFMCTLILLNLGCDTIKVKGEVQESYVKVLSCPAPRQIKQPDLPIHNMTEEQKNDPGEVAKHYKATIQKLMGYSKTQKKELDKYQTIHDRYKKTEEEIRKENKEASDAAE